MSDLVAGGVPESPGHAAINPESAEDGIQDDSTMAPLVVRDQGEVGSSSLTDKRSGDEWEEEMAREKARRGLEAEERSTTQAKVQILRDARRVDKEEERMRAKAKEAGRKFSELEDAGRAKSLNEASGLKNRQVRQGVFTSRHTSEGDWQSSNDHTDLTGQQTLQFANRSNTSSAGRGGVLNRLKTAMARHFKQPIMSDIEQVPDDTGRLLTTQ